MHKYRALDVDPRLAGAVERAITAEGALQASDSANANISARNESCRVNRNTPHMHKHIRRSCREPVPEYIYIYMYVYCVCIY